MQDATNSELLAFMKNQAEKSEARFDSIDSKLAEHDERFEKLDARLIGVNNRVDQISGLFTHDFMERFHDLEKKVEALMSAK